MNTTVEQLRAALPDHAWRYLAGMCEREREWLASADEHSLQLDAAFDSLGAIENIIPVEFDRAIADAEQSEVQS